MRAALSGLRPQTAQARCPVGDRLKTDRAGWERDSTQAALPFPALETSCLGGYRRRREAPHLCLSCERLGTAGGVQPISGANPFLNVFISMCRLHFREKTLEKRQSLSRNSGKGNGIVK